MGGSLFSSICHLSRVKKPGMYIRKQCCLEHINIAIPSLILQCCRKANGSASRSHGSEIILQIAGNFGLSVSHGDGVSRRIIFRVLVVWAAMAMLESPASESVIIYHHQPEYMSIRHIDPPSIRFNPISPAILSSFKSEPQSSPQSVDQQGELGAGFNASSVASPAHNTELSASDTENEWGVAKDDLPVVVGFALSQLPLSTHSALSLPR